MKLLKFLKGFFIDSYGGNIYRFSNPLITKIFPFHTGYHYFTKELFGMLAFSTEILLKEIRIRKVMGTNTGNLIYF
ncbi:hypothetical protein [Emticicia sp. C21]|uniref:hypothetical protein n=1 Tax=Emticicia sp. C21 TaxID=2302915 RepID=UPI000E343AF5|nr:hypothetical protein [Emticicia sp. C21]RFS18401.1 hypothetical protein D0T08_03895 [Emticicia sp. C21]